MTQRARAATVQHLSTAIRYRCLSDIEAAAWLGVSQEKIEALHHGDYEAFSSEELDALCQTPEPPESMPVSLQLVQWERLEPRSEWNGGRITNVDVLTLEEAAQMASKHAWQEITIADFLRAAGRGEITLHAIVHRTAQVRAHDGRVFCNAGQENQNIVPAGCIVILPLTACQHLANIGHASWRTFDGFKDADGAKWRYAKGILLDGEPDFQTVPADCRVTGYNARALADAFEVPAQPQDEAPKHDYAMLATPEQLIAAFGKATGMDTAWFRSLKDRPKLQAACEIAGKKGKGGYPPLFRVIDVLRYLMVPRRDAAALPEGTAWRLLEQWFPDVYARYSVGDTRDD